MKPPHEKFLRTPLTRTNEASLGNLNQATSSVRLVGERYEDMKPGPSTSRDGGEFVPIVLGNMTNNRQTKPKLFANHPEHLEAFQNKTQVGCFCMLRSCS